MFDFQTIINAMDIMAGGIIRIKMEETIIVTLGLDNRFSNLNPREATTIKIIKISHSSLVAYLKTHLIQVLFLHMMVSYKAVVSPFN